MYVLESSGYDYNGTYESLADAFSDSLIWEWDNRFGGILAAFEARDKDRVFGIISSQLAQVWDSANINDAPTRVSGALKNYGALKPGQLLFISDFTQDVILLGLWWPWGNGTTISIRFVPYGLDSSESEKEDMRAALKGAFGL
jgi:hypothetical protein